MKKTKLIATASVLLCLASSACLKTRAQLREDSDNSGDEKAQSKPVPAEVKEVQPQGGYAIDEIKGEMTRLEGRMEDLERAQKDATAAQGKKGADAEDYKKLEERVTELEQAQASMLEAIKKMQESPAAAASEAGEALSRAKAQFDAGNYEAAAESLTAYLKSPKAPKAEEATYLRAESYYNLKQYKKAIVDYSKFPEKYTKSPKLPTVLLRIGQSFDALGMHDDAKGFYTELIDKFPKSSEAKKARAKVK